MADSNPPHEVNDGKTPSDRDCHSPNADAADEQISRRVKQHHREQERYAKTEEPRVACRASQDDRADLVGYGSKGVPRLYDGSPASDCDSSFFVHRSLRSYSNAGLGLRTSARYVVRW